MKWYKSIPIMLVSVVLIQGCVSNKKYAELESTYSKLRERNQELSDKYQDSQRELSGSSSRVKSLEEQIRSERANVTALPREAGRSTPYSRYLSPPPLAHKPPRQN